MSFIDGLRRQVVLGHVSGIPVRADRRWFFVLGVMTLLIALSVAQVGGGVGFISGLFIGLAVTFIFFLSIFLHEFSHAAIARIEGIEVVEIVLHPFGGMTRLRHEPETPRAEFRIAIAGPVASFVLAILFVGLATAGSAAEAPVLVTLGYSLALLNFLIAIFNMLPGYPLDGGRVLRAYLWRSGRDLNEATILTGRFGQVIAAILILFGLGAAVLRQEFFTGFWAVLSGLFLYDSAKRIICDVRTIEKVTVEDAMMLPMAIPPDTSIRVFVDQILPMNRQTVFPVAADRQLHGVLVLEDIKVVENTKWRRTGICEVMRPVDDGYFVGVGTLLHEARELARTNAIGMVCVVDGTGKLVGVVHAKRRES